MEYLKNFVDILKFYESINEYGGVATYSDIMNMPYPLFYELIEKQVAIKKKERERIEASKTDSKGRVIAGGKVYRKQLP
jgi:hypothetical protein